MATRDGGTARRRGQPRDDEQVLAEAHASPRIRRGQVYATGDTREGRRVFRTTRFYGTVFVTIVQAYLETHAPVPCERCKEAVYEHSEAGRGHKNPFAIIAQLERAGLLQPDDGARDSNRLPRVNDVLVELDDGTVLWPMAAEPSAAADEPKAPKISYETFVDSARARFGSDEFTSKDALAHIPGATRTTVYNWLRHMERDRTAIMVGGMRASRRDPPRYQFVEPSPTPPVPEAMAAAVPPAIKSRQDLEAEIAALTEEIDGATRETDAWQARCDEADARVAELERQLKVAKAHRHDLIASRPEPKDVASLVTRRERLRQVSDNYDLLLKST